MSTFVSRWKLIATKLVRADFTSRGSGWIRCALLTVSPWMMMASAEAAPRLISDRTPRCVSCHVSPQGRGLLNGYGRGIDIDQSLSPRDLTGELLGYLIDPKYDDESWKGHIGNVLADVAATARINRELDTNKTDPSISALYRQIVFFGEKKRFRVNTELGLRDGGLPDTKLGENLTAVGGDRAFVKKLTFEWRMNRPGTSSGSELAVGRDYLPIGMQIDDASTYILHLNRNGIYDFPLQIKYTSWNEKSLYSTYLYAPSFNDEVDNREYGGGGMYEYYPTDRLVLGAQSILGLGNEADRLRVGGYVRWGLSRKWSLLGEVDYTQFWGAGLNDESGGQTTAFLQLHYKHYEWLVSSLTGNYVHGELLNAGSSHFSARYTLNARLNRNVSVGVTYTAGDIRRNLDDGQEGAVYISMKF